MLSCDALQTIRAPLLHKIITEGSRVFAKDQIAQSIDLLQLIINSFAYILSKTEYEMTLAISKCLDNYCASFIIRDMNYRKRWGKQSKNAGKHNWNVLSLLRTSKNVHIDCIPNFKSKRF